MVNKREIGEHYENMAVKYLEEKGHSILGRNFHSKYGEIDIISKSEGCVVFSEVKYRCNMRYGHPAEAVTPAKQNRIRTTAKIYIAKNRLSGNFRFDVIAIDGQNRIEHIVNAFY